MKIYIGPYKYRFICNIFNRYMDRKYKDEYPLECNYTKIDNFMSWLDDFIQSLYNNTVNKIIDESERKIKVKIHDYDLWSMDNTLAHIILPMLKKMKYVKHGAPIVDYQDVPEFLHPTSEQLDQLSKGYTDEKYFRRWDWVLDEMIFAFESEMFDWESQFYSGEVDFVEVPIDADGNQVPKDQACYFSLEHGENHTFKVDKERMEQYQKRIQNGFRLFGKYYSSLWD